ncbi:hypothetical protein ASB62_08915 [Chlorobium limicola]|uniref:Uncharacterized protein n=1 Tax=Chlorobium limicola TaxID=1092 RepID=A0A101J554_CHLLI|nr:hypothetical protein ASB62_08915 [Chlorobium limicola]
MWEWTLIYGNYIFIITLYIYKLFTSFTRHFEREQGSQVNNAANMTEQPASFRMSAIASSDTNNPF